MKTTNIEQLIQMEQDEINSLKGFMQMVQVYNAAIKEIKTKLEILDDEFKVKFNNNPIHHMESRLKSPKSILGKLQRKNLEISLESACKNIHDIAGIRVVCYYVKDIYTVAELLLKQNDVTLVQLKDYIKNPKKNGYRSLHLVVQIPVFLSEKTEHVEVEIQIRTVAMDFWASLEHQIRYKHENFIPQEINEKLLDCAKSIAELDITMQDIHNEVHGS